MFQALMRFWEASMCGAAVHEFMRCRRVGISATLLGYSSPALHKSFLNILAFNAHHPVSSMSAPACTMENIEAAE